MPFRILSFDGGGIRGLLSTLLLRRLIDESSVSDLIDRVDMFAGTSTGGLIALGLASEIPLDRIKDLYLREGPKIFAENFFGQFRDVGNLFRPQYSNRELRQVLGEIFGDKKLGDLKRRVMIPAFELDNLKNLRPGESRRWRGRTSLGGRSMGGKNHSDSDGSFTGDGAFSVCPVIRRCAVLSGTTNLPGRLPNGLGRPDSGNDGFRSQVSEFERGNRLDQAKLAIRRMDENVAANPSKRRFP